MSDRPTKTEFLVVRPRDPISAAGLIVVILIAALGFASVSADESTTDTGSTDDALPIRLSARVAAAGFSAVLNPAIERQVVAEPVQVAASPRVAPTATTTPPVATTTTSTTTTTAPSPTTTTPPTTTTAPPPTTTTAAPTTTTAPPATTTTAVTTTTTLPPVEGGSRDVEEWRSLVEAYFPADLVDGALSVMRCESLGDPLAYNSSSGASGLFQFIPSTWAWASPDAGFAGASPFEPAANIGSAAWLVQRSIDQGRDPWVHWSCKP